MKRGDKQLYEKIMRSVSKEIKHILNEDTHNFDVTEYDEPESVVFQDVREVTKTKNVDNTIFDWLAEALEYLQYERTIGSDREFGSGLLSDINNNIYCDAEEILNYDEYTIGELVKQAIQKGISVDFTETKKSFNSWLYSNYYDCKEDLEDSAKEEYKTVEDIIQEILDDIDDFIDNCNISEKALEILQNDNNNLSFKKWIKEFYS